MYNLVTDTKTSESVANFR